MTAIWTAKLERRSSYTQTTRPRAGIGRPDLGGSRKAARPAAGPTSYCPSSKRVIKRGCAMPGDACGPSQTVPRAQGLLRQPQGLHGAIE